MTSTSLDLFFPQALSLMLLYSSRYGSEPAVVVLLAHIPRTPVNLRTKSSREFHATFWGGPDNLLEVTW